MMVLTKQPKKRQIKRLMSKCICTFYGRKGIVSPMYFESPLARDYCYFLEFDQSVLQYESEPLGFIYWNPITHKESQYTPDFKVWFTDGSVYYYEIKYLRDIKRSKNFDVIFQSEKKQAQLQGSDLILVTDEFISKNYLFENLVLLYRYVDSVLDSEYVEHVKQKLKVNGETQINDLINSEIDESHSIQQLYKLIWLKEINIPIQNEFLSFRTEVSLNDGYPK